MSEQKTKQSNPPIQRNILVKNVAILLADAKPKEEELVIKDITSSNMLDMYTSNLIRKLQEKGLDKTAEAVRHKAEAQSKITILDAVPIAYSYDSGITGLWSGYRVKITPKQDKNKGYALEASTSQKSSSYESSIIVKPASSIDKDIGYSNYKISVDVSAMPKGYLLNDQFLSNNLVVFPQNIADLNGIKRGDSMSFVLNPFKRVTRVKVNNPEVDPMHNPYV